MASQLTGGQMMKRLTKRRPARRAVLITSAVVIALVIAGSLAAFATAASVTPETVESWASGNAQVECQRAGCTFAEYAFKVEPWDEGDPSGTYAATGGASISITAHASGGEYKSFDWSISQGYVVHCVIVKAGTGALIYRYGEEGATGDSGLVGYANKGISHATFCYSKKPAPTGDLTITKQIVEAPNPDWNANKLSHNVTVPAPSNK
jgi:hypothetical protein